MTAAALNIEAWRRQRAKEGGKSIAAYRSLIVWRYSAAMRISW